mmetsp:Transcript_13671/g.48238  ORF Transcript_13671/g.48238 Transcript_13671/m.48238 type:complete len:682 (-) Transcript_13671:119-2164(-)|eukprot:CAMPEP_0203874636 /NCGR_PEP_ID=MMETSP0359-20131031/20382_1 /ASSEMBLY_ACC=CAM_ASM_000338 /TAXON_ID=268821 /ORGANISM="Scrippsiella Hangoei, Strain SHTV-5" /LENGTH=681 /DNA_ID=CAMNT_0050793395 /DNA_START=111 /DNA_END=2156 /DNA_ORIENTATION=-
MFSSKVKDEIVSSSSDESSSGEEETSELRVHFEENGGRGVESADLYRDVSAVDTEILMRDPPSVCTDIKPSAYALPPASLTFRDLSFSLEQDGGHCSCFRGTMKDRPKKVVLAPCSGHFEPGELTAIMGPSGSGKTTLLDMLAMKKTSPYEGEVFINGRPRDVRLFRRIAAYVGQEDIMPAHWKVREAILFNATLKYCTMRSHRDDDAWVDVLLETFGLAPVQDSLIGGTEVRGISGGQRRRVSLARGVAAHASLLFCDEPTSGLSATDAELCIRALRTISKRLGVTILVVIHQPRTEVAELFDRLLLLTSFPGRMVYFGKMMDAQDYWFQLGHPVPTNVNPCDFFMDTVTPGTRQDVSKALVDAFLEYEQPLISRLVDSKMLTQGPSTADMLYLTSYKGRGGSKRHNVGFCAQFCILFRRKLRLTARNPMALALPIIVPILQGTIVGWMFQGTGAKGLDRKVMFSFCMLTMLCLAGTMGLIVLINDRILMKHEASEQLYSEGAWALATQAIDIPLALVGALLNVCIMLGFAEMQAALYNSMFLWALLLFFVYDSLFAFIAAVAADTRQAQVLASPCVSIFMLFNGFIVTQRDSPFLLKWIFAISPNAYAMQAIVIKIVEEAPEDESFQGNMLLASMGLLDDEGILETPSLSRGFLILCTMIFVLRIGQMVGLKCLNHIQR